jgi:hypothetical protein
VMANGNPNVFCLEQQQALFCATETAIG